MMAATAVRFFCRDTGFILMHIYVHIVLVL